MAPSPFLFYPFNGILENYVIMNKSAYNNVKQLDAIPTFGFKQSTNRNLKFSMKRLSKNSLRLYNSIVSVIHAFIKF